MVEPLVERGTPSMFERRHRVRPRPRDLRLWTTQPVTKPDRLVHLVMKLVALSELDKNWNSYGAEPPSEDALREALRALQRTWATRMPETVLPSVEGGVTLVYSTDAKKYAEIEFGNTGEIVAAFRRPGRQPRAWTVRDGLGVVAAVSEICRHLGVSG